MILFDKEIFPRLTSQKIDFWKAILRGRRDIEFPDNCLSNCEKIGHIIFIAIMDFSCKGCIFDKLYRKNDKFSEDYFEKLINQCLVGVKKENQVPNSKFDVIECILSGIIEALNCCQK